MKAKPRWMKSLLKAADSPAPTPPFARQVRKSLKLGTAKPA